MGADRKLVQKKKGLAYKGTEMHAMSVTVGLSTNQKKIAQLGEKFLSTF